MFRKSKLVCVIATLLLGVSTFVISGVSVYASDFEEDSVEQDFTIETNAKCGSESIDETLFARDFLCS